MYYLINVKALIYPVFVTDLQPPMATLLTQASGVSILADYVYSNWFQQIPELVHMGVKIRIEGRSVIIEPSELNAAKVEAPDLRAGVALVIAGLVVPEGVTELSGVEYIDRGYDHLVANLRNLGAEIWRHAEEG
ncbi:hypothetical protein K7432_012586 [Basidiobolus ranarum]|uniref:UDP-N-acetylglucosamine 1-carboxyvinyltransferase n=1 Tax=Basidiobolus ranarum TaxID=34480 RepID=A0ABR2WKP1_9FUNG